MRRVRTWFRRLLPKCDSEASLCLPQSHCRHTFITLALEHFSVNDVAYLVGNSPEIIYRHYASRSRISEMPEF
jgi:hypothetical protein